ncbi:hypothetical protein ACTMTF_44320 [Nonomuraea sp. ZG12]|uniref:hypothetical protein n=1 Tax=Nonomuraea sp. ZG12 TaxID=3452207 RepID=UPI003F888648
MRELQMAGENTWGHDDGPYFFAWPISLLRTPSPCCGCIPLPLVPETAWVVDEAVRRYILFFLTKGQETKIEIPTTNRPGT